MTKSVAASTAYTITFELLIPGSCFTALGTSSFASWIVVGDPGGDEDSLSGRPAPTTDYGTDSSGPASTPPQPIADRWAAVKVTLTHTAGTSWNIVWSVDGRHLFPAASVTLPNDETDPLQIQVGALFASHTAGELYYARNLLVTDAAAATLFESDLSDTTGFDSTTSGVGFGSDPAPGSGGGSSAQVRVSVAFDDPILEPNPTWTRITSLDGTRVQHITIDRGRASEFNKTDTGTAVVTGVDRIGVFDPTNTTSVYAGLIRSDLQAMIELRDPVEEEWQTIFRGYVEDWKYTLEITRQIIRYELSMCDAFGVLAKFELLPGEDGDTAPVGSEGNIFYEDTDGPVGDRLIAILADVGWADALQEIYSGNVKVLEDVLPPGTAALTPLQNAADAEFPGVANLYVSREGIVTFHGRQARLRPDVAEYKIREQEVGDPSVTEGDATIAPVSELGFSMSESMIVNACYSAPQGIDEVDVADQWVKDDTSILDHGRKSVSFDGLLTKKGIAAGNTANEEAKRFATYDVANYATQYPRVDQLVFKTRRPSDRLAGPLWKMLCRSDISDLLTLTTAHPGGGGFAAEKLYVEGVHYDISPLNDLVPLVELRLDVSPQAVYLENTFDDDTDPE